MSQKATTIKDAICKFEEKKKVKASECDMKIDLTAQIPPIEKMDASLSTLTLCTQLSLSTNCIEKIANLNALKNLKILTLSRNSIKSLAGLEAVSDTLEELWISYNLIDKFRGVNVLKKLKVLYIMWNRIADDSEFNKLADLPCLETLSFKGNPWMDQFDETEAYRKAVTKRLPRLKMLENEAVTVRE